MSPIETAERVHRVCSHVMSRVDVASMRNMASEDVPGWLRPRLVAGLNEIYPDATDAVGSILTDRALDQILGLGALEPLLRDLSISQILIEGPHDVKVIRGAGEPQDSPLVFHDEIQLRRIFDRICNAIHKPLKAGRVQATMGDGSKLHAWLDDGDVKAHIIRDA